MSRFTQSQVLRHQRKRGLIPVGEPKALHLPEPESDPKRSVAERLIRELGILGTPRCFTVKVKPMGAPRQTRKDKWKPRQVVLRYREYCDEIRKAAGGPIDSATAIISWFYIPVPESISANESAARIGQPHRQPIDSDNAQKAVADALIENDGCVYFMAGLKRWCARGEERIEVAIYG